MYRLVAIFFWLVGFQVLAQDIITYKDGKEIEARVLEISDDRVRFKKFSNLQGPDYVVERKNLTMILFENGTKEVFSTDISKTAKTNVFDSDMHLLGMRHASIYYNHSGPAIGNFFGGLLLGPALGLVPAFATATTPPASRNLNFPDHELFKNTDYMRAYLNEAHRKKKRRVWTSYGTGAGIIVGISFLLVIIAAP